MKRGKLQDALNQVSDNYIAEAAQKPKRQVWRWAAPVAAVLVIAILLSTFWPFAQEGITVSNNSSNNTIANDAVRQDYQVATPVYPLMAQMPNWDDYDSDEKWDAYDLAWDAWKEGKKAQYDQPAGYADGTDPFFAQTLQALLGDVGDGNAVCSPVNIYMALAMLAQTTEGQSRQEIMDALGCTDMTALQTQAGHIWNAHYCNDNATFLTLANSLWLDGGLTYNEETAQALADSFYASVFRGDLGSDEMNQALRAWINDQTGGLLQEQAEGLSMDDQTVLALASTIYYRCKWSSEFWDRANTEEPFHSPSGDRTVTFMHASLGHSYYWGDKFGAVSYSLDDGSKMWLILPDEGFAPDALLSDPQVLQLLQGSAYENKKDGMIIHLSLPKFDICSDLDLQESLQAMGVRSVFTNQADFSAILPEQTGVPGMNACLSSAQHAARVAIDEEGITAAAYTVLMAAGAAPPPDQEIQEMDFTLDRPFLFVVESRDGLPLFAGIVNEP